MLLEELTMADIKRICRKSHPGITKDLAMFEDVVSEVYLAIVENGGTINCSISLKAKQIFLNLMRKEKLMYRVTANSFRERQETIDKTEIIKVTKEEKNLIERLEMQDMDQIAKDLNTSQQAIRRKVRRIGKKKRGLTETVVIHIKV